MAQVGVGEVSRLEIEADWHSDSVYSAEKTDEERSLGEIRCKGIYPCGNLTPSFKYIPESCTL
jgi:hypothetical protein